MDHRFNVVVTEVGNSIHMGYESDGCLVLQTRGGRKVTVNVAVFVYGRIFDANSFKLLNKLVSQVELTLAGWVGLTVFVAWGANCYIMQ